VDEIDTKPLKRNEKLSMTAVTMLIAIAGLFGALLLAGELVIFLAYRFEGPIPFGVGLLLGCALSAAKVVLLERSLNRAVDLGADKAKNYARFQMVLRYGLTIVVVLGAVFFRQAVGLFGIIAGLLSLQLASYIASIALRKKQL